MNTRRPSWFARCLAVIGSLLLMPLSHASEYNLPASHTQVGHTIYSIHMMAFWVAVGVCAFVFAWMAYNFVRYRKSKGAEAQQIHGHVGVEILWSVIPAIILILMAIPATKGLMQIHNTAKPDMTVEIIGYQWKWRYKYLDEGIDFFSNLSSTPEQINGTAKKGKWFLLEVDKPMVVPVGQKIRLLVTADDVIHDWWVPSLGVKQDAVPGYINENWMKIDKPGIYRGECAELCGVYHGFMPIVVKAVPLPEYRAWVAKQKKVNELGQSSRNAPRAKLTSSELLAKGKVTYLAHCAVCHQKGGKGLPPTFPALINSPIATGPVAAHIAIVVNGKAGTTMQSFKNQLSEEQLAAVITYERHAWGNDKKNKISGNPVVVQPADIAKQLD